MAEPLPWQAGAIERRPVDALRRNPRNARIHPPEQIEQLVAAIREFGFTNPLLVDEHDEIIAGHGRLDAAVALGLADVPVIVRPGLDDAAKTALRLADNKIALNAGWDDALLAAELAKLQEMGGVDLALTGFDSDEVDRLLASIEGGGGGGGSGDADASAPEPPVNPVTRPGDRWLLGSHRLLCGDSTVAADVERLLAAARDMLVVWEGVAHPELAYRPGSPAARLRDLIAQATAARATKQPRAPRAAGEPRAPREGSKQETVLGLLRREGGATIADISEATGWQAHTVRGFFVGLKKRQGIEVQVLERVRKVGPNQNGAKGSYTVYGVAG